MRASAAGEGFAALGHDRPVDQREERQLVARDVEADRLAGFERGALREEQRQALQAGLADAVDLGVAGDDVGEPGLDRRLHGEVEIGGALAASLCCGGAPADSPLLLRACLARTPACRTSARRSRRRAAAPPRRAAGACAESGRCRRPARTPPARRARAARAPPSAPARAGPAARRSDRPRAARSAAR